MVTDSRRVSNMLSRPTKWLARRLSGDKTNASSDTSGSDTPASFEFEPPLLPSVDPIIDRARGILEPTPHPLFLPPDQHRDYWPPDRKRYFLRLCDGAYQIWPLWRWKTPPLSHEDTDTWLSPSPPPLVPTGPRWQPERPGPANTLPPELWIHILSYLDADEALSLRPVNRTFAAVAMDGSLHRCLNVNIAHRLRVTYARRQTLQHVQHMSACFYSNFDQDTTFNDDHPALRLLKLLRALPTGGLRSLRVENLQGSCAVGRRYWRGWFETEFWRKFWRELARVGSHLEELNLTGSDIDARDWARWSQRLGMQSMRRVNVARNRIYTLPFWPNLEYLDISHTYCHEYIERILTDCPHLMGLDASFMRDLCFPELANTRVVYETEQGLRPTALREIRLLNNNGLTVSNIRALQARWATQRAQCQDRPASTEVEIAGHPNTRRGRAWLRTRFGPTGIYVLPPFEGGPPNPNPNCQAVPPPRPEGTLAIVHNATMDSDDEEGAREYINWSWTGFTGYRHTMVYEFWV